jgi:hypothetical protein
MLIGPLLDGRRLVAPISFPNARAVREKHLARARATISRAKIFSIYDELPAASDPIRLRLFQN